MALIEQSTDIFDEIEVNNFAILWALFRKVASSSRRDGIDWADMTNEHAMVSAADRNEGKAATQRTIFINGV